MITKKKILVTGSAGFIGSHLTLQLLDEGNTVIGIDNHNSYYDVSLKEARLKNFLNHENYTHNKINIEDNADLEIIFKKNKFDIVVNLAAQAGVRHSILNPQEFIKSNIIGFHNILDLSNVYNVGHLVYASSSSVYGSNSKIPFSVEDSVAHPISTYAMTKRSNELLAHVYSHLYNIPTTGLRFFTVYGPYGRPDMALFNFSNKIINNEPIDIFNKGNHKRDFTYISDVVEAIIKIIDKPPKGNKDWPNTDTLLGSSKAPWRIYNVGNSNMVELKYFIELIEKAFNKTAIKNYVEKQPGDIEDTHADINELINDFNFKPKVSIDEGIKKFVDWYKDFYKL